MGAGVAQGADEGDGDDDVRECQPVRAVGEERVGVVRVGDAAMHEGHPLGHGRPRAVHEGVLADEADENVHLGLNGERGHAAHDQCRHEEEQHESGLPEKAVCLGWHAMYSFRLENHTREGLQ